MHKSSSNNTHIILIVKCDSALVTNSAHALSDKHVRSTRSAANTIIDGPTAIGYSLKQIGTGDMADGAIQPEVILREGSLVTVNPEDFNTGSVSCLSGEVPVSGGLFMSTGGEGFLTIKNQRLDGNGWLTEMANLTIDSFTVLSPGSLR